MSPHLAIVLTVRLAAADDAASPASTRAADARKAAVRQADRDRCAALAARDADRFVSLLADDVAFFPDQRPVARGKEAVRVLLAPFFDAKGPKATCEPLTADVSRAGDLAYTTGRYQVTGSPTRGHGKYVTVWRRRPGGWTVAVDIGNAEPPPERDFGPPPPP